MSKIQWLINPDGTSGETWNPVTGCSKVSEGCRNCYAERIHEARFRAYWAGKDVPDCYEHPFDEVTCHPERLNIPLHWKKPRTIFVCSMGDLFHEDAPDEFIDRVLAVMALTLQHRYIVLTKRPKRMSEYIMRTGRSIDYLEIPSRDMGYTLKYEGIGLAPWPLQNLILGVSVENQATANERIPWLLKTPAACRAVSYEPALEMIDFADAYGNGIDWFICGGESGPHARPMHPEIPRSARDQCADAGVPFFFKQWGDGYNQERDSGYLPERTHGGNILDGQRWEQLPEVMTCRQ